jgi:hypothetical protein
MDRKRTCSADVTSLRLKRVLSKSCVSVTGPCETNMKMSRHRRRSGRHSRAPCKCVVACPKTGERTLDRLWWGLVPYWCKDEKAKVIGQLLLDFGRVSREGICSAMFRTMLYAASQQGRLTHGAPFSVSVGRTSAVMSRIKVTRSARLRFQPLPGNCKFEKSRAPWRVKWQSRMGGLDLLLGEVRSTLGEKAFSH